MNGYPTLEQVRAAAETAKDWLPELRGATRHQCGPGGLCDPCCGARRARLWVEKEVDSALSTLDLAERSARHRRSQWNDAVKFAEMSARVESLFGAPGPVAAFRDLVVEFCR